MKHIELTKTKFKFISYALFMLYIFIALNKIGGEAMAYFGMSLLCYLCFYSLFISYTSDVGARVIKSRLSKGQYKNVKILKNKLLFIQFLFMSILTVLFLLISDNILINIFGQEYMHYIILTFAPVLFLRGIGAVLDGYTWGEGRVKTGILMYLARPILYIVFSVMLQGSFCEYGEKVSALLKVKSFIHVYSAWAFAAGMLLSEIILLVINLTIYFLNKKSEIVNENSGMKKVESVTDVLKILFNSNLFENLIAFLMILPIVIFTAMNSKAADIVLLESIGDAMGSVAGGCGIFIFLIISELLPESFKCAYYEKKKDYRAKRSCFKDGFHIGIVNGFYFSVLIAAIFSGILQLGALIILPACILIYLCITAIKLAKKKVVFLILLMGDLIMGLVYIVLDKISGFGLNSVVISLSFGFVLIAAALAFYLIRMENLMFSISTSVFVPAIAACVCGLICIPVKALVSPHISIIALGIVLFILVSVLYYGILVFTNNFTRNEYKKMFLGRFLSLFDRSV